MSEVVVMHPAEPGDPPETDRLRYLGISVPADLDMQIGYDPHSSLWGDNRYVAFYFIYDEFTVSDGYSSGSGEFYNFNSWDFEAGKQLLKRAADAHDDTDVTPEDIEEREYVPRLTKMLYDNEWDIGSADSLGNAAFLLDREANELFVGERGHVEAFCQRFNDGPPEWVEDLPDDPDALMDLFERAVEDIEEDLDDDPLFGGE